ncbi:MAG: hypothetical protein ACK2UW_06660 [Anaerolineales bacterium]|jgi:hypothetical protein
MIIKTNLRAGACYTTDQGCYNQRDFWKEQANKMEDYALGEGSKSGLYISPYPPQGYSGKWGTQTVQNAPMTIECINTSTGQPVNPPVTPPTTPSYPITGPGTGGVVGGMYYPDNSYICNGSVPPTSGGGLVGGVYYPDRSYVCSGTTTPPTTTPPGGGLVGGVYYPDRSGVCSAA